MSWALIAHTIAGSTDANFVGTTGIDTRGADLIVLCCGGFDATAITFGDNGSGNSWTVVTSSSGASSTGIQIVYMASPNTLASHTFSANANPLSAFPSLAVLAFSGSAASPLDTSVSSHQSTGTTSIQAGAIIPAGSGELLIATAVINGAQTAASIDSSFTETDFIAQVNGQHYSMSAAYLVDSDASSINPAWSWTPTNSDSAAAIAAFKTAAGGTITTIYHRGLTINI